MPSLKKSWKSTIIYLSNTLLTSALKNFPFTETSENCLSWLISFRRSSDNPSGNGDSTFTGVVFMLSTGVLSVPVEQTVEGVKAGVTFPVAVLLVAGLPAKMALALLEAKVVIIFAKGTLSSTGEHFSVFMVSSFDDFRILDSGTSSSYDLFNWAKGRPS